MFEHRTAPLLPFPSFLARMGRAALLVAGFAGSALGIGVLGYHHLARLAWIDALLNASMILGGMGPVDPLPDRAAKLFASAYALFAGVVFITSMGVLATPIFHRLLHRFHLEEEKPEGRGRKRT
jgi:hypothetical protein